MQQQTNKENQQQTQSTRIAMGISYCGTDYFGWQKQAHTDNTVQHHLETALSFVANHTVELVCAGRTDSGVHGTGQVIHFDTTAERSDYAWKMGVNTHLPKNIRVNWVRCVDKSFHVRFSATYRRYHYIIEDNSVGNAIFNGLVTTFKKPLNVALMHEAAQYLLGEQDFTSFRAAQCQSHTPFRCVDKVGVSRNGNFVIVDIQANAFLYHMVRNIVGALLIVGQGKKPPEWIAEILSAKDRCKAPATASADGLYLVEVGYDEKYNIPIGSDSLPFII